MIKSVKSFLLFTICSIMGYTAMDAQDLFLRPIKTSPAKSIELHDLNQSGNKVLMSDEDRRLFIYDLIGEKYVGVFEVETSENELSLNQESILDAQFGENDQQIFISIQGEDYFITYSFFLNKEGTVEKIEKLDVEDLDWYIDTEDIHMHSYCNLIMLEMRGGDFSNNNAGIKAFYQNGQPLKAFNALAKLNYDNQGKTDYLINDECTKLFLIKENVKKEKVFLSIYRFDYEKDAWKKTKTYRNIPLKTNPVNDSDAPEYFLTKQGNKIFSIAAKSFPEIMPKVHLNKIDLNKKKAIFSTFEAKESNAVYNQLLTSITEYGGISHFSKRRNFIKDTKLESSLYENDSVYVYTDSIAYNKNLSSYTSPEFFQYFVKYNVGGWARYKGILKNREISVMRNGENSMMQVNYKKNRAIEIFPEITKPSFSGGTNLRKFDSYDLTQETGFNVLPKRSRADEIVYSNVNIRCEKPDAIGLMSGITISYLESVIKKVEVDCEYYNMSIFKSLNSNAIEINLKEVLLALHSKMGGLSAEGILNKTSYINDEAIPIDGYDPLQVLENTSYLKIAGINDELVHFVLDVLTQNRVVFAWNTKTKTIEGGYRFNYSGFPDVWNHFSSNDSVNYFYDFRVDKELKDPITDYYDYTNTLLLYKYNINNGEIKAIDSTLIDLPSLNIESLERTDTNSYGGKIDFYEGLGIIVIVFKNYHVLDENQVIIYDVNQKIFLDEMYFDESIATWSQEDIERTVSKTIHPLLKHIYSKVDYSTHYGNYALIANVFDVFKRGNEIFTIYPNGKINILCGNLLLELQHMEDETKIIGLTTVEGSLINHMPERNILVTKVSDLDKLYHVYGFSPTSYKLSIQYTPNKVRFESNDGFYTEFATFQNKEDKTSTGDSPEKHRPDKILELLNYPHAKNKLLYERVASLNTKKLKTSATKKTSVPTIEFEQLDAIKKISTEKYLQFNIRAIDNLSKIDQIKIMVNGVSQVQSIEESIDSNQGRFIIPVNINLSWGKNLIEIFIRNEQNQWSLPLEYVCYYMPNKRKQSKLLFAGIGFSEYQDSTKVLNASDDDIRDILQTLRELPDFQLVDTLINYRENIKPRLKDLNEKFRKSDVDDRIVLLLSGHGMLDADKLTWYFATYNTQFNKPSPEDCITFEDLDALFDGVPARNRLILIDACHAGQSYFEYLEEEGNEALKANKADVKNSTPSIPFKLLDGFSQFIPEEEHLVLDYEAFKIITKFFPSYINNGETVVTASRGEQTAKEDKENGFFTRAILDILKNNSNKNLTINEFVKQIDGKFLEKNQGQKPSLKGYNPSNNWVIWDKHN